MRPLPQQTILITGATDGLGRGLAFELARTRATILAHGRDDARGLAMVEQIRHATGNGNVHWLRADFASLVEVHGLADQVIAEYDELHALVNNAGIGRALPGDGQRMESRDGYELRFAVNYLAGYLLTRLLTPLLIKSAPARIVNVSSAGQAPIDFGDVMLERDYTGVQAYCQSKLAQVMFTFDLAEELEAEPVTANCLHPATHMPTKSVRAAGVTPVAPLEEGVRSTGRLVIDATLDGVSGRYFRGLEDAEPNAQARDPLARRRLHELSDRLVGL